MAMACQSAISSFSSSSSAAISFSAAKSPCSSSAKAPLLLPPPFQGLCSSVSLSRARLLRPAQCRRASSSSSVAFGTNILYSIADAVWDIHGQSTLEQPRSNARIVASLDSDGGKAEGARKALEQAFQGKNNIAKKWEEEIRKRELSGGDGSSGGGSGGGGGGGWGGGGGDEEMGESFGQDEPWDWEEAGQTFMATFALTILYISITRGPKQVVKKFKLLFRFIWQGFRLRKIPEEYLRPEGPEDDSDEDYEEGDLDVNDDDAHDDFIRNRQAELSISNAREGYIQNNDSVNDETEDEDDDYVPTPQSKRENLLSKRQAEQKERLLQLLTPKQRRQQEENK